MIPLNRILGAVVKINLPEANTLAQDSLIAWREVQLADAEVARLGHECSPSLQRATVLSELVTYLGPVCLPVVAQIA